MEQMVQQLQQQLAEQEQIILEKDDELKEAVLGDASLAHMYVLAYEDASQQHVMCMTKYETAQAELETVSEANRKLASKNGALSPSLFAMLH